MKLEEMSVEEIIEVHRVPEWCAELMKATGKSKVTVYKIAKRLHRTPTVSELVSRKNGRPRKW